MRHKALSPFWTEPIRQGNDFVVCAAAKLPLSTAPQWVHEVYGFMLAVLTWRPSSSGPSRQRRLYRRDAGRAPIAQLETGEAYGMSPQRSKFLVFYARPADVGLALAGPVEPLA